MKYRCVFHVRESKLGRLKPVEIYLDTEYEIDQIVELGAWVDQDHKRISIHSATWWLPPHKIEFIERIEE